MELTKISSKGQIVIPQGIREKLGLDEGETLVVSVKDGLIVLKKIEGSLTEEDLNTLIEIKDAWQEIESGKCKKMKSDEFLREISKW
ncbi:AbrB family transcriptional regulator [Candidatus Pacearchaeota archaeon CG_4_10_14_0_2_um_filter_05_32_18]|nr:MAG: AbrB family transcriptional regulator [Candidatus Pacearchaeota archaeon CG_4_10_14_0_2_um_filter_05_32_18]